MRLSANRCSLFSLFAATALSLFLAGCASLSLDNSDSSGASAFDQALSKNYQGLADSFATATAEHSSGFFSSPLSYLGITSPDEQSPTEMLAKLFADKAQLAAGGKDVAPEPATNSTLEMMRARLVRAVDAGKDRFPEDAARAQADYDCWVVNTGIASQSAAAFQCHTSFNRSLGRLEAQLAPAPPPPVATAPAAPAAVSGAPSDYTVYFDFNSWSLSAQDLAVLTHVIDTARAGGQTRITVVGHTDTSGSAAYNQRLSVRRANVVVEALVDMGARREAITASGVGKRDLAVQTRDGVREAKNRRAVIDLLP